MIELGPDGGALVVGEDVLVAADVFGEFAAQRDGLVVLPAATVVAGSVSKPFGPWA